jgi:hypothetical protein
MDLQQKQPSQLTPQQHQLQHKHRSNQQLINTLSQQLPASLLQSL